MRDGVARHHAHDVLKIIRARRLMSYVGTRVDRLRRDRVAPMSAPTRPNPRRISGASASRIRIRVDFDNPECRALAACVARMPLPSPAFRPRPNPPAFARLCATVVDVVLFGTVDVVVVDRATWTTLRRLVFRWCRTTFLTVRARATFFTTGRFFVTLWTVVLVVVGATNDPALAPAAVATSLTRTRHAVPSAITVAAIIARRRRRPLLTESPLVRGRRATVRPRSEGLG